MWIMELIWLESDSVTWPIEWSIKFASKTYSTIRKKDDFKGVKEDETYEVILLMILLIISV